MISECYPYTTLVGVAELGYDRERPRYKRKPRALPTAQWRPERAANCDDLIHRLATLEHTDPPLRLRSHPATHNLVKQQAAVRTMWQGRGNVGTRAACRYPQRP